MAGNDATTSRLKDQVWEDLLEEWHHLPSKSTRGIDITPVVKIELETLRGYISSLSDQDREIPTLEWWRSNASVFQYSARIARVLLCISASSAASERLFSSAEFSHNKRQQRMFADTISKRVIVRDYFRARTSSEDIKNIKKALHELTEIATSAATDEPMASNDIEVDEEESLVEESILVSYNDLSIEPYLPDVSQSDGQGQE